MDGWNTTFLLGRPIFRGELLVSGSVSMWSSFSENLHWANGCFYWKRGWIEPLNLVFVRSRFFTSKRVINFESWCFRLPSSWHPCMKRWRKNLGEGSKSIAPKLVALKIINSLKAPDIFEILSRVCTRHTHRHTVRNPLTTLILIESAPFLL